MPSNALPRWNFPTPARPRRLQYPLAVQKRRFELGCREQRYFSPSFRGFYGIKFAKTCVGCLSISIELMQPHLQRPCELPVVALWAEGSSLGHFGRRKGINESCLICRRGIKVIFGMLFVLQATSACHAKVHVTEKWCGELVYGRTSRPWGLGC
jgi:hypothetical protein